MKALPTDDTMYRALVRRDPTYDGLFFVGVRTTGIFCRSVCPARKPRRDNVQFFGDVRGAVLAGFRPCRRCRPTEVHGQPPAWVRVLMDEIDRDPTRRISDAALTALGIEPVRVRRHFKEHYGMTFHAWDRARRMGLALRALRALPSGATLDDVGYAHGFESSSGFRDAFTRTFGAPPGRGRDLTPLAARWIDTRLGAMLGVAVDEGVCLLEFVDRRAFESQVRMLQRRFRGVVVPGDHRHLDHLEEELEGYFEGELTRFRVPLALRGTAFQMRAWERLARVGYGETIAYGEMAADLGCPGGQRAVANANGRNRLAILLPCHRVIGADGALTGYGGGLWRKRWMLDHEVAVLGAAPSDQDERRVRRKTRR